MVFGGLAYSSQIEYLLIPALRNMTSLFMSILDLPSLILCWLWAFSTSPPILGSFANPLVRILSSIVTMEFLLIAIASLLNVPTLLRQWRRCIIITYILSQLCMQEADAVTKVKLQHQAAILAIGHANICITRPPLMGN